MKLWRYLIIPLFIFSFFSVQNLKAQTQKPCSAAGLIKGETCVNPDGSFITVNTPCSAAVSTACYTQNLPPSEDISNGTDITASKTGIRVCPDTAYSTGMALVSLGIMPALCSLVDIIFTMLGSVSAGLMYLGASLFDYSINFFVLNISKFFLNPSATETGGNYAFIYTSWSFVRDITNILIVFMAIYSGLMLIIGAVAPGDWRKGVAKLIIAALLINFSFAITKFAIDAANVVSLQIYGSAAKFQFQGNITQSGQGFLISDYGISTSFAQRMGISGFVVDQSKLEPSGKLFEQLGFVSVIMSIVFFCFGAWMFFKLAIFITIRTIMLIGAVVFSPLMFIGGIVPIATKIHDKWREIFFGNLMVAPLIVLFLWLSLRIIDGFSAVINASQSGPGTIEQVMVLLIVGLCLWLCAKYAEMLSGAAGQFAVKVLGGAVGGAAMAVGTAGTGFVARAGLARAAAMSNRVGSKWATQEGAGRLKKFSGNLLLKGGERLEKSQVFGRSAYDLRRATEQEIDSKRSTVLRENRVAAKDLGWTDRLEQEKSEAGIAYIKKKIEAGERYEKDKHEDEIKKVSDPSLKKELDKQLKDVRAKPEDRTRAAELIQKIKTKDDATQARIETETSSKIKLIETEYEDQLKTRLEGIENMKRDGASKEDLELAQGFVENLKQTRARKIKEVTEETNRTLTEQKEGDPEYSSLKQELSNIESEYQKTTTAYKAGSVVGELIEQDKKDLAAVKSVAVASKDAISQRAEQVRDVAQKTTDITIKKAQTLSTAAALRLMVEKKSSDGQISTSTERELGTKQVGDNVKK